MLLAVAAILRNPLIVVESVAAAKLDQAVDSLVGEFDPKLVALYLHVFNLQTSGGWDSLTGKLAADPRLALA